MLPMLMRTLSWVLVATCTGLACVGQPPPPPVVDNSTASTTEPLSTSSTGAEPMSTQSGPPEDSTTVGTTAVETSSSGSDTTMGVDPTTAGSESTSGPPPECTGPAECDSNQDCMDGRCVEACGGAWGMGSYGYCLTEYGDFDTVALCGPDHVCIYVGNPIEQTACSIQGCTSVCDCPPPPATGNATVSCGEITEPLGMNDCYLSCADGETCPDGMACNFIGLCMTNVTEPPVYGNCGNLATDCAAPGFCTSVPSGVCMMSCNGAGDCPAAVPPGGNATIACSDIDPSQPGFECYLGCFGGLICPNGMTCINGTLCMWPD